MGNDGDLYKYIDTWDGNTLFTYITISIFILWYMNKKNIDLKVTIIIIGFVLSYLNYRSITTLDTKQDIINLKKNMINPHLQSTSEKEDIINFIYSIQELYIYNPYNMKRCLNILITFLNYINYHLSIKKQYIKTINIWKQIKDQQ